MNKLKISVILMFEKDTVLDEPSNTVFRVTYYVVAVIAGKDVTVDMVPDGVERIS